MTETLRAFLKAMFLENYNYKLISAAMVFVLFFWVLGDSEGELSMRTTLRPLVPEGQVLMEDLTQEIKVTVAGRLDRMRTLGGQTLEPLIVDLRQADTSGLVVLRKDRVQLPPGLRVVRIQPRTIQVDLKPRKTKSITVRPRIQGKLPEGFAQGKITTRPRTVTVTGPAPLVDPLRQIESEPLSLADQRATFTRKLQLQYPHPTLRDDQNGVIEVEVEVVQLDITKKLKELPVSVVNLSRRTKVTPTRVDLTLKGPRSVLQELDRRAILVSIDMKEHQGARTGVFQKTPVVRNLPEGVTVEKLWPTDFQVQVLEPEPATPEPAP